MHNRLRTMDNRFAPPERPPHPRASSRRRAVSPRTRPARSTCDAAKPVWRWIAALVAGIDLNDPGVAGAEVDEEPGRQYVEWFGDDNLVFSTDYPHGDSKYPHSVEAFEKLPLSDGTKRKVVGDNWSRLYDLPLERHRS